MKTYTLETKFIPTKEILSLAVLGCVYNAAVGSDKLGELEMQDEFNKKYNALFLTMTYIARLSIDQKECLNRHIDNVKFIMSLYSKIPEQVKDLCDILPEPVEIVVKGPLYQDYKQLIPDFPEDKIKISYTYENENLPA